LVVSAAGDLIFKAFAVRCIGVCFEFSIADWIAVSSQCWL
jgi:hypothetical protein